MGGPPDPKYRPPMLGPHVRRCLFVSVVLALWAFVRPAMAMPAGLRDHRAACAIAPPPALQPSDASVRRAARESTDLANVLPFDGKVGGTLLTLRLTRSLRASILPCSFSRSCCPFPVARCGNRRRVGWLGVVELECAWSALPARDKPFGVRGGPRIAPSSISWATRFSGQTRAAFGPQ